MRAWLRLAGLGLAAGVVAGCVTTPVKLEADGSVRAPPTQRYLAYQRRLPAPADAYMAYVERPEATLEWEVDNRFRLIAGQQEETRFERNLGAYITEYRTWFAREHRVGPLPNFLNSDLIHAVDHLKRNFTTRYSVARGSYRCFQQAVDPTCRADGGNWILDRNRDVVLHVRAWKGRQCSWTVGTLAAANADCDPYPIRVELNARTPISVRLADGSDGGASSPVLTDADDPVVAHDLRIVALGDSFSAGEGNPHAQWRLDHPAIWLDPRCHRSLMSGPSLAAAFIARRNPHLSVTLLHYGCSGASIADGVATPWANLETAERLERRNRHFRDVPADQRAAAFPGIDVPPSQIEQARRDLTVGGKYYAPDVVLLSVGGNDIGFADIVRGLVLGFDTPADLSRKRHDDLRPSATFDQAMWAAQRPDCRRRDRIGCFSLRAQARITGTETDRRGVLTAQYALLAPYLSDLTEGRPARVLITEYPNFMRREPDERAGTRRAVDSPDDTIGCVDRPLDGRPGMMPAVLSWIPVLGIRPTVSDRVDNEFLGPLNGAIRVAAEQNHWTVVSKHVLNGRGHGYCSFERYYNTVTDSFWNQGRSYAAYRPLGNVVILKDSPAWPDLHPGDRLVWNDEWGCYLHYGQARGDTGRGCALGQTPIAFYDLKRLPAFLSHRVKYEDGGVVATTGIVHPNLFGHCNYASAIVTEVVLTQASRVRFDPTFDRQVRAHPKIGLTADEVCSAEDWGFTAPG
jgi:hypothetical protein